ncbi:hypothetical protein CY34DRAFT_802203, partial [Suillus luteus UH-Slu-Lm8-n1]
DNRIQGLLNKDHAQKILLRSLLASPPMLLSSHGQHLSYLPVIDPCRLSTTPSMFPTGRYCCLRQFPVYGSLQVNETATAS